MKREVWCVFLICLCGCTLTVAVIGVPSAVTPTHTTLSSSPESVTPTEDESSDLVEWLMRYGYLPPPDPSTGQLQAWTAVTHAVRAMQKFAGLKETGFVDKETLTLMQTPRCSLPDNEEETLGPQANQLLPGRSLRRKRAVVAWTRKNINWRLGSYPGTSSLSRETIRSLVFYALRVWAEPTPLEFHEVAGPEMADLQVDFLRGFHGDGYPFDGAGGAVGHAFFPSDPTRAGGVHLDAEEDWAFRQPVSEGTDLFTVLVHEFGHALGLSHSSTRRSVMRPYYQGPAGDPLQYRLGTHDQEHITNLYGKRSQLLASDAPRLATEPLLRHRGHGHRHKHSPSVDRCNTSFDAVAKIRGETFFFKGLNMWRVSAGGLVSDRAASVRRLWGGLPSDLPPLKAVLERHSDHAIIFISGSHFWLFKDLLLQEGYPQPLSELREMSEAGSRSGSGGLPGAGAGSGADENGGMEQGLVWDPVEGPVWANTREAGSGGQEEDGQIWTKLIRDGVNGISEEHDGSIILFKGHSYWKFPYPGSALEEGYPRSLATDWLDCPNPSAPVLDDLSLSFSPPTGRQELRERWTEERGREEKGGQWRDQGLDRRKGREGLQPWPCTCINQAVEGDVTPLIPVLVFTLIPLLFE